MYQDLMMMVIFVIVGGGDGAGGAYVCVCGPPSPFASRFSCFPHREICVWGSVAHLMSKIRPADYGPSGPA